MIIQRLRDRYYSYRKVTPIEKVELFADSLPQKQRGDDARPKPLTEIFKTHSEHMDLYV